MSIEQTPGNESLGDKVRRLDAKREELADKIETFDVRDRGETQTPNPLAENEQHELERMKVEWNETQNQMTEALQQMTEAEQIAYNAPIAEQFKKIMDEIISGKNIYGKSTPKLITARENLEAGLTHKNLIELCEDEELGNTLSNGFRGNALEDEVALRKGGRQFHQY
jgi:hypothetical protein